MGTAVACDACGNTVQSGDPARFWVRISDMFGNTGEHYACSSDCAAKVTANVIESTPDPTKVAEEG